MYQDLSTHHEWPVKKAIAILPIRLKGIFSGFLFATAKIASITARIFFHIILLQTVKQLHQSYLLYGTKFDGRGHRVSGKSIITVMAPCTCAWLGNGVN